MLLASIRRRPRLLIAATATAAGSQYFASAERRDASALARLGRTLYHFSISAYDFKFGPMATLPRGSAEQRAAASVTHQRAADGLLAVCLAHGGLYVKLGQFVASLSHVLPPHS